MRARALIVAAIMLAGLGLTAALARGQTEPAVSAAVAEGAPVIVDGKTLFTIKAGVSASSTEERARAQTERIVRFARDPSFRPEAIGVREGAFGSEIVAGDHIVSAVFDVDARAEGRPRAIIAREQAAAIRAAIERHRRDYSTRRILIGLGVSLGATLAVIALLSVVNRLHGTIMRSRFYRTLADWSGGVRLGEIHVRSLPAAQFRPVLAAALGALWWLVVLILLYAYVQVVMSSLPWTRAYANRVLGIVLDPLAIIGRALLDQLPNLAFIVVLGAVTYYALRLVAFFFRQVGHGLITIPGFYPEWAMPTWQIARVLVIAVAVVAAFPYIPGSASSAFQGVSIFLGVLFSLGSTSAVANAVAGIVLTYMRAYRVGDFVKIADSTGDVIEKTLLVTRIRTIKNEDIAVPNSMILNAHVVNYSAMVRDRGLILHTAVTIGYDAPWRTVHELLMAAALATGRIKAEPRPFVLQTALNDFYVTYELNAYTDRPHEMPNIYSDLHQNIQDRFNEAGVEIMSPHYAQLRDGNQATTPAAYLPKDYAPRAIRVVQARERDDEGRGA